MRGTKLLLRRGYLSRFWIAARVSQFRYSVFWVIDFTSERCLRWKFELYQHWGIRMERDIRD